MTDGILRWMYYGNGPHPVQKVLLVIALAVVLYLVGGMIWNEFTEAWRYIRWEEEEDDVSGM